MNGLARYVLSVTAAALLVAVLHALAGNGSMGALIRLLGGVFMALTVLSPVLELRLPDLREWTADFSAAGAEAAAAGEEMAYDAAAAIITGQIEAYIMDKAALYGADPSVSVTLDADGLPVSVKLVGDTPPAARRALTRIMEEELGIGEEAQEWISESSGS